MNLLDIGEVRVIHVELSQRIGLNEAIFVGQLHYWLKTSKHTREDQKWVYNTLKEWNEQFPFWSLATLKRVITSCQEQGLIRTGEFNKAAADRTRWYTIEYDNHRLNMTPPVAQDAPVEGVIMDQSNHKTTQKITSEHTVAKPTVNAVMQDFSDEPEEMEISDLDPITWRWLLRAHGHTKVTLPQLTIKQQGQLKFLKKKLGGEAHVQVAQVLKHWEAFSKFVKAEYGKAVTNPKNLQKFIALADAISEFEPPEEFVPSDTPEKTLDDTISGLGKGPVAENPDLEL